MALKLYLRWLLPFSIFLWLPFGVGEIHVFFTDPFRFFLLRFDDRNIRGRLAFFLFFSSFIMTLFFLFLLWDKNKKKSFSTKGGLQTPFSLPSHKVGTYILFLFFLL